MLRKYTAFLMPDQPEADIDGRFVSVEACDDDMAMLIAEACCLQNEWVEEIREEVPEPP